MRKVVMGNWILVISTIFYLLWWVLTFRTDPPMANASGRFCMGGALLMAAIGALISVVGINSSIKENEIIRQGFSGIQIFAAGVILYMCLFLITNLGFHRQVSMQLPVFSAWFVLMISEINYFGRGVNVSRTTLWILSAIVSVTWGICVVCYIIYSQREFPDTFFIGYVPVFAIIVSMVSVNVIFFYDMFRQSEDRR